MYVVVHLGKESGVILMGWKNDHLRVSFLQFLQLSERDKFFRSVIRGQRLFAKVMTNLGKTDPSVPGPVFP